MKQSQVTEPRVQFTPTINEAKGRTASEAAGAEAVDGSSISIWGAIAFDLVTEEF